jgi:hypothetical protein
MKLNYKNRMIIILIIACIFIGSGIFQMIFKIKINEEITRYGETGLFIVAGLIFFGRKNQDTDTDDNEVEDAIEDEDKDKDKDKDKDEDK